MESDILMFVFKHLYISAEKQLYFSIALKLWVFFCCFVAKDNGEGKVRGKERRKGGSEVKNSSS